MANNYDVKDKDGTATTFKSTDTAGVHTGHSNVDTIAEGASVDIGDKDDAAVITDAAGSLSAKLRGLVKWAFERMPASLGQKTSDNSLPVVLPSDQNVTLGAAADTEIGDTNIANLDLTAAGQQATTTSAVVLPSNPAKFVLLKALSDNADKVFVGITGVTTSTGLELSAGEQIMLPVKNSNELFIVGIDTSQTVAYMVFV